MLMVADSSLNFTQFQVRFSVEKEFGSEHRISPIRKEPKKARQQAHQKTFLFVSDQFDFAIS
jgi:hypothetical protein